MRKLIPTLIVLCLSSCYSYPQGQSSAIVWQRGFGELTSFGLDTMANTLDQQTGLKSIVGSSFNWQEYTKNIINDKPSKVILCGHSLGGLGSILIAKELQKHNIDVDLMILYDPVTTEPIPSNVKICIDYYVGIPLNLASFFIGSPVLLDHNNTNTNLIAANVADGTYGFVTHVSVTDNKLIQEETIKQIIMAIDNH